MTEMGFEARLGGAGADGVAPTVYTMNRTDYTGGNCDTGSRCVHTLWPECKMAVELVQQTQMAYSNLRVKLLETFAQLASRRTSTWYLDRESFISPGLVFF